MNREMNEIKYVKSIDMLPLQGANRMGVILTQGFAIGLEYDGLSARKRHRWESPWGK